MRVQDASLGEESIIVQFKSYVGNKNIYLSSPKNAFT